MNWTNILSKCGVKPSTAAAWHSAFESLITPSSFSAWPHEVDDFIAQILHESGMLERSVENLTYTSAARICQVWPRRFATEADALPYVRNPQALANKVYGARLGNTAPDDGWRYRGRGLIMVTGKANYAALAPKLGVDIVAAPDKLATPHIALKASILWWEGNVPDSIMGDVVKVTRKVNGGTIGLDHRRKLMEIVQANLKF